MLSLLLLLQDTPLLATASPCLTTPLLALSTAGCQASSTAALLLQAIASCPAVHLPSCLQELQPATACRNACQFTIFTAGCSPVSVFTLIIMPPLQFEESTNPLQSACFCYCRNHHAMLLRDDCSEALLVLSIAERYHSNGCGTHLRRSTRCSVDSF